MTVSDSTKVCSRCKQPKDISEFHKNKYTQDGHRPDCKTCRKHESATRYQKNAEHIKQRVTAYASRNKDRIKIRSRQWRSANRNHLLASKRLHHHSNRLRYNRMNRENWKRNKERYAIRRKLYELSNPDLIRFHKMLHETRKRQAHGTCTSKQWREKCAFHGWRCIYCRTALTSKTVTIEHRKPLSRNGTNWPANLAPCCRVCNQSKNNKTEPEFRAFLNHVNS